MLHIHLDQFRYSFYLPNTNHPYYYAVLVPNNGACSAINLDSLFPKFLKKISLFLLTKKLHCLQQTPCRDSFHHNKRVLPTMAIVMTKCTNLVMVAVAVGQDSKDIYHQIILQLPQLDIGVDKNSCWGTSFLCPTRTRTYVWCSTY